jgi:uroporphyrinogen decarboxylase
MRHRDRVLAALSRETPDRCPFQASFTPEFAARLRDDMAVRGAAAAHNPHGGGNTYELERALGQDMLLTSVGWANSYYREGDAYVDEWGVGWKSVPYTTRFGTGRYTEIVGHPLADDAAIASYRPPDPARPELYHEAERVVREFGGEYWIVGVTVTTIFECAWALRGLERLLMDLIAEPDAAHAVLEIPYRYHLAAAERLAALGVDMLWIGDDVGMQSGMLMAPATWRTFLKPRLATFIERVKGINPELRVAYHSDGNVRPIVPELIEIGVDVLNPVQPRCMDPAELKRSFGDRLCFWGSIDEQHTLPFAKPARVREEVLERLRTLGAGGGLIIGPTHHVQLDTPLENFWAMVEAIVGPRRH